MAKTSQWVRQQRPAKYKTREYSRCRRCGRPRAVYRKFGFCRMCLRGVAHGGVHPGVAESERRVDGVPVAVAEWCGVVVVCSFCTPLPMPDPISDFLTRIRNAINAAHETVE